MNKREIKDAEEFIMDIIKTEATQYTTTEINQFSQKNYFITEIKDLFGCNTHYANKVFTSLLKNKQYCLELKKAGINTNCGSIEAGKTLIEQRRQYLRSMH